MSQLKSIDHCKVGMTVYHPAYGKGEITAKATHSRIEVSFEDFSQPFLFWDTAYILADKFHLITHLYTEPVYICKKAVESCVFDGGGHLDRIVYKPINQDK